MPEQKESKSDRIYRKLMGVLPQDFRSEFGGEMELVFHDQRVELEQDHGWRALLKMWWAAIVDIFRSAPREHWNILSQDLRYAFRMMRNNIGFTLAAIFILGLGIGANTAIFSVVNSVLLKPLPYLEGDRLVVLHQKTDLPGNEDMNFSVQEIQDYREQNQSLTELVEYHSMTFTLFGGDEAHQVRTGVVSPQFFDLFGVHPILGRTFVADDDRAGAELVLLLSYEFWKNVEGGNPNILGKKYRMNERMHTVVGVLPPIPQYPNENDIYMPVSSCPSRSSANLINNRDFRMMSLFGRLKNGETLEHCKSNLMGISHNLAKEYPASYKKGEGYKATASFLRDDLTKQAKPMLLALLCAAAFVLLIACANVGNLILARMARREQELMIRSAVGAGSGRILRQLLTENLLLAFLAAGVGLLFAAGSLRLLTDFAGQITPRAREISLDRGVLIFAMLCAGATTILFGSVAAMHSRKDLSSGLKEGGRAGSEARSGFIGNLLITAQVAFSCILLIGAGLMVNSFIRLSRVDPGFTPQNIYAVSIGLNGHTYMDPQVRLSLMNRIIQKLQSQPGVLSVAVASSYPLDPVNAHSMGGGTWLRVEGDGRPERGLPQVDSLRRASTDYFKTMGIPLLSGRTFLDSDDQRAPAVALVNRALATHRWGSEDPIGKRVSLDNGKEWVTIVGVVGDVKEFGLGVRTPNQMYRPIAQMPDPGSVLVRTVGDPVMMTEQLRRALHEVDPEMPIASMITMEQAKADSVSSPRTLANLFGLFAILALNIAIAGIGSMLALWVRQRVREIGIRMAMGASPHKILLTFVRRGMIPVVVGLVLGMAGAVVITRMMATLLFQVAPTDIATFCFIFGLLLVSALAACFFPARRASQVDPQIALRCE